ncbi:unnamed protein product [Camellia sinensis]
MQLKMSRVDPMIEEAEGFVKKCKKKREGISASTSSSFVLHDVPEIQKEDDIKIYQSKKIIISPSYVLGRRHNIDVEDSFQIEKLSGKTEGFKVVYRFGSGFQN